MDAVVMDLVATSRVVATVEKAARAEVLKDAMALYRRLGYREIEPYGPFVGMEGAVCLEYIIQRKD